MFSKARNFLKKLPLSNYIVLLLCLCVLVIVSFFSLFLNLYGDASAENNLIYNRHTTTLYADKANSFLESLTSSAASLCDNTEVGAFVQNMSGGASPSVTVRRQVVRYLVNTPQVYDIVLSDGKNRTAFYMDSGTLSALTLTSSADNIIQTAFINNNQVFLIPVEIHYNARAVGTCYLVTYSKAFVELFDNDLNIAESKFFVLSNTLQLLAAPSDTTNETVSTLYSVVYDKSKTDEFTVNVAGEEHFVKREQLVLGGISIYGMTPRHAEFGAILSNASFFSVIFALALIILLFILYWFFRSLNRSIGSLRRFITDKKNDDDSPVPDLLSNELTTIAREIDETVDSIKELQHENLSIKIAHKDSQIKALQNQLNPHFLYNTLNCVVGMARYYHIKDIERVCLSIAKITQYSLSANLLTTVGDEIKIINDYMTIQQVRFQNKFKFFCNVDASLFNYHILRFSLQPLVENAIKYGLEPLDDGGELKIGAYLDGEALVFEISDNGVGFESEIYKEVQQRLADSDTKPLSSSGTGIGLLNIHNRIRLFYGNEYGITIDSDRESGTKITLRMPRKID